VKIIGLCGGSGSGKGYCAEKIAKYHIPTIDTDVVYHSLISSKSECLDELVMTFGDAILENKITVNRAKLRQVVFSDPENLLPKLNAITHKHIYKKTDSMIREYEIAGARAVLVEVPLMFESGFDKSCDFLLKNAASYCIISIT
jgi:dephospho-CoA kinase